MRDKIKEFMDNKCIFIIDTNVYLNLYEFSPDFADVVIDIIFNPSIKDNIYVPNTVKMEFDKLHKRCSGKQEKKFQDIPKNYKKSTQDVRTKINIQLNILEKFEFPGIDNLKSNLNDKVKEIDNIFTEYVEKHNVFDRINEKFLKEDKVLELIESICTEGRLLNPLSDNQKKSIYEEGEERYSQSIPPGFKDGTKNGVEKYNDLLIWKETIQFCKKENCDLIFVGDDEKGDWWIKNHKEKNDFHIALIKEFEENTGRRIIGITSFELYRLLANILKIEISNSVERVLKFSAADYIKGLVESENLKESLSDELIYSGDSYVSTDSLSHYDGTYFEIEEILAIELVDFEFEGYRHEKAIYEVVLCVEVSAHSKEYVVRDSETGKTYLGQGYDYTLKGEVFIKIKRDTEIYREDLLDDISFDDLEVISGELVQIDWKFEDDSGESIEAELEDWNHNFCVK